MLKAIRNYILKCTLLVPKGKIGIEYLDNNPTNYAIEKVMCDPILEEYIDGSSKRQFLFSLTSREFFGQDEIEQNITNDEFYQKLYSWLENNNKIGFFPELETGKTPTKIKALSSGYLFSVDSGMKKAKYKIQCQLIYEMEEN